MARLFVCVCIGKACMCVCASLRESGREGRVRREKMGQCTHSRFLHNTSKGWLAAAAVIWALQRQQRWSQRS
jgi:hypothetical protein